MIKVLMFGCNGQMGRVISDLVNDMDDIVIAAGVDAVKKGKKDFSVMNLFRQIFLNSDQSRILTDLCMAWTPQY